MIKSLYKCFQHWSEKGSVYVISDPHFGDLDMNWRWSLIKDYPFPVLDWMNEEYTAQCIANYIVWKINKAVHKDDTLIILGDIGDVSYVKQLKAGYKVLVKGNHDSGTENYKRIIKPRKEKVEKLSVGHPDLDEKTIELMIKLMSQISKCSDKYYDDNKLFDEVYEGPLFISEKLLLTHEPLLATIGCYFNIHGHVHSKNKELYIDPMLGIKASDYFLNVSCEKIDFTPINLGKFIKDGKLHKINTIHRFTIDGATARKERANANKEVQS